MMRGMFHVVVGVLLLAWPALADMYPDASNAKLPAARENLGVSTALNAQTDFGAKGDNTTDDGPALASAFAACSGSKPLYLPPGKYLVRRQLYLPRYCQLYGDRQFSYLLSDDPNADIIGFTGDDHFNAGVYTGSIAAGTFSTTGSIAGRVYTVTAVGAGQVVVGATISGTGVTAGTKVQGQLTGTPGGIGTYEVGPATMNAASTTISGTYGLLSISAVTSGSISLGNVITGSGVTGNTVVTAFGTGTGGTGTYVVNNSQTISSQTINSAGAVLTALGANTIKGIAVRADNIAGHANAIDLRGNDITLEGIQATHGGNYSLSCMGIFQLNSLRHSQVSYSKGTAGLQWICADGYVAFNFIYGNAGNGVDLYGAHTRFIGNKVETNGAYGARVYNTTDIVVSGNDFTDNGGPGLYLNGFSVTLQNVSVTGNVFNENALSQSPGTALDCHLELDGPATNVSFSGNVFKANASHPGYVWCGSVSSGIAFNGGSYIGDNYQNQVIGLYQSTEIKNAVAAVRSLRGTAVPVASLATCNAAAEGATQPVTDANSTTFNAAVAAGGSNHINAYCNGTGWVVH